MAYMLAAAKPCEKLQGTPQKGAIMHGISIHFNIKTFTFKTRNNAYFMSRHVTITGLSLSRTGSWTMPTYHTVSCNTAYRIPLQLMIQL